ncbi:MAG: beta-ketoacyl synthase chain length factor, partial [Burkholderiaceae bacterium]|nr:beta-ketoacyl synthase chain length factor [Burkholderiaceae bacterium]
GYWGIATKSMAPCQVICAYDASFGAGLLDALSQVVIDQQITLLISYDSEYPEPLHSKRQLPDCGGVALLLTPEKTSRSLARISVSPTTANADSMAAPELEMLRRSIPALHSLPLLQKLACSDSGLLCLDYLPPMQLAIDLQAC